ncbi:MAG: alpha/beta hydrolase [Chitinophagaceae bacterium]|nr:alpha/beta hydrolase [Chitinophagaceae bacterium]
MQKVYFISGLGADKRIFDFLDLRFCEPVFLNWLTPGNDDTLPSYAKKMAENIKGSNAIIVGLSFGGMLATEMAKQHPGWKVILIASAKTKHEVPWFWRAARYLPVYKWIPGKWMKVIGKNSNYIFGAFETSQKKIISQIITDTDPQFSKWAIGSILHWQNETKPANVLHLHGTADKLLPLKYLKADHVIDGGTHLMLIDKAPEISVLLRRLIET